MKNLPLTSPFFLFLPVLLLLVGSYLLPVNFAQASLTTGLVPLEVQPASGLAVAIGDLLLTGLVGNSTFDGNPVKSCGAGTAKPYFTGARTRIGGRTRRMMCQQC